MEWKPLSITLYYVLQNTFRQEFHKFSYCFNSTDIVGFIWYDFWDFKYFVNVHGRVGALHMPKELFIFSHTRPKHRYTDPSITTDPYLIYARPYFLWFPIDIGNAISRFVSLCIDFPWPQPNIVPADHNKECLMRWTFIRLHVLSIDKLFIK